MKTTIQHALVAKKKVLLLLLLMPSIGLHAGFFTKTNSRPLCAGDAGLVMQNMTMYYFAGTNLSITATEPGESALCVAENAVAYIYVGEGQTLRLKGGNGSYQIGGGAGIEVPKSSTLYILGGGVVEAIGGDVGLGVQGRTGLPGAFVKGGLFGTNEYYGGEGGAGGAGGGGAGAGIGGCGGRGGDGATSAIGPRMEMSDNNIGSDGTPANDGGASESGKDCGKVYLVGSLQVVARSGATSDHTESSNFGSLSKRERGGTFSNDFIVGGGGAGGNGNNGLEAAMIGGGGAGAAGAGSGSSGGITNAYILDFGSFLKTFLKTVTQKLIDAMYVAITHDPTAAAAAIINLPLIGQYKINTIGGTVSDFIFQFVNIDLYPLQINGGGGQGSSNPYCRAYQIDGFSFYCPELKYKNWFGTEITRHCPPGGQMGVFGTAGSAQSLMKTPYVRVSQKMDILEKPYPQELIQALTFTLSYDESEVDMTKPHPGSTDIVYGDSLPSSVTVPTSKDGKKVFIGYTDELGQYWYNMDGKVMPTARDSSGKELSIYVHPGDVILKPKWENINYVVVRHWQQKPSITYANGEEEYNLTEYEMVPHIGQSYYRAGAKSYAHFTALKAEDSVMVNDTLVYLDFYYDRQTYALAWNIPEGIEVLTPAHRYTQPGDIRFGSKIRGPRYAKDKTGGGYYRIIGWKQGGQEIEVNTMPPAMLSLQPILEQIDAHISYTNEDRYGTVTQAKTWLGTNMVFSVVPKDGWELDSCFATFYGMGQEPKTTKIDQSGNDLILYGSPEYDSIAVRVNYRGVVQTLTYTESTANRSSTMTLYISGDSITNDGGINMKHSIRNGQTVGISPLPTSDGLHATSVVVRTKSGKEIPTKFVESYDERNHYVHYYQFDMPNEEVNVVATYKPLADHPINLRIRSYLPARVYCNRGELLDSTYLFSTGYMVEAGELIWIETPLDSLHEIDSIQISYREGDSGYKFLPMERKMFVTKDHPITKEDTVFTPIVHVRYSYRVPDISNELLIEFKYKGSNFRFESEMCDGLLIPCADPRKRGIYTPMGIYMGEDLDRLPKGLYIVNGKKILK